MLFLSRKSASLQGATDWRTPASSPWPPSVSRSTDRVTQNNGIDPKPFWRLRAIPGAAPHQAVPGAPLAGCPGVGNWPSAHRTTGLGALGKMGTATNSLAVMASKQRTQPELNGLAVPDFRPEKIRNCHKRRRRSRVESIAASRRGLTVPAFFHTFRTRFFAPSSPVWTKNLDISATNCHPGPAWKVPKRLYITRTKRLNSCMGRWQGCHF